MPHAEATQDYLKHYFDIARYQALFALIIGVFMNLFLLVFRCLQGALRHHPE